MAAGFIIEREVRGEMMNKMEVSPVFYRLLRGGGRERFHREGVATRRPSLGAVSEVSYSTRLLPLPSA